MLQNVRILTKPGERLWQTFHKTGTVVAVDKPFALSHLARHKKRFQFTDDKADVEAGTVAEVDPEELEKQRQKDEKARHRESSEIHTLDFPGTDDLHKAGITTVEQLEKFMEDNGDAWFEKVNGIGKSTAAKIVDHLASLDK